jgi:hypothetical protein
MKRTSLLVLLPLIVAIAVFCGWSNQLSGAPEMLPTEVKEPGNIDRVPSPQGDHQIFCIFAPPQQSEFGVAASSGAILWKKSAGFRPMLDYVWSKDGKHVLLVTDCMQAEAELRSPKESTRSYFFLLEALTGTVVSEGDLDTDVLDLAKDLPDAVGASHELQLEIADDKLMVSINHQGKIATAGKALKDLPPPSEKK